MSGRPSDLKDIEDPEEKAALVAAQREEKKRLKAEKKAVGKAKSTEQAELQNENMIETEEIESQGQKTETNLEATQKNHVSRPSDLKDISDPEAKAQLVAAQREEKKRLKAQKKEKRIAKSDGSAVSDGDNQAKPNINCTADINEEKQQTIVPRDTASQIAVKTEEEESHEREPLPPLKAIVLPRVPVIFSDLSPRITELAILYRSLRIVGGNARTVALLGALKDLIHRDTSIAQAARPLNSSNAAVVNRVCQKAIDFLNSNREFTSGMNYVVRCFKDRMTRAGAAGVDGVSGLDNTRDMAFRQLAEITDDITHSFTSMPQRGESYVMDGDTILVYGRSSSIEAILTSMAAQRESLTVIIIDSAPLNEGQLLLWRLQQRGIKCVYALLSSVCVLMPKVTKVFLGASAVLQSGGVLGRAGTAMVALAARAARKPVLCFCETYKFSEKVWMGSLTMNQSVGEMGLLYDLTPKEHVDVVVSEIGPLHPTAIAAAIRDRDEREANAVV